MKRISRSPDETFDLGREIGVTLKAGSVVLFYGGLGAGKTLLTKGIMDAMDFDINEVTSPSFSLVNLYNTEEFDVYHVDLWRVEDGHDAVTSVGLDEILEDGNAVTIIEWAEKLGRKKIVGNVTKIRIEGEGDEPRNISVKSRSDHNIVIRKAARELDLFCGEELEKTYKIALSKNSEGTKEREGDGRTPEGDFFVFAMNPKSRYHLSLALSYPDMAAVENGFAKGVIDGDTRNRIIYDLEERKWIPQDTPLGGNIYIHGGGNMPDWTDGCIALGDDDMAEIFEQAEIGMRVSISA
ncbi:MAG TPA: tRNA (adenosine(37)-N6)-threonylcarbamoyltransferase complex ATPase subunit type 1 TsaE [Pyrinomonadaceae bacterium]|nr:tRNA (adenosine(37)-N6)-threonylcarbamoyltransferase complex ATPase subunit type 1 TsaE [Pyrinomonadaceae bacterium]